MTIKKELIDRFISAIDKANTIALFSHVNPDGDTCGSALALYRALKMYGKTPYIFCDGKFNDKLQYLDGLCLYNSEQFVKCDVSVAVDCADLARIGNYANEFLSCKYRIFVDHHGTNDKKGDLNIVEPDAAATAEVVFDIINAMNERKNCMDATVAKLLYCALVTDSGGFSFSSVTQKTLSVASELITYGFKANEIFDNFIKKCSHNLFDLKNRVLSKAKFYFDDQVAGIFFMPEDFESTGTTEADTDGIINNILNVIGVKIAFSVTQIGRSMQYKVSFRTVDGINAAEMAQTFGGGGHKNAAGCRLSGYFEDVKDKILKTCGDYIA